MYRRAFFVLMCAWLLSALVKAIYGGDWVASLGAATGWGCAYFSESERTRPTPKDAP